MKLGRKKVSEILKYVIGSNGKGYLYFYNCKVNEAISKDGVGVCVEVDTAKAQTLAFHIEMEHYDEELRLKGEKQ